MYKISTRLAAAICVVVPLTHQRTAASTIYPAANLRMFSLLGIRSSPHKVDSAPPAVVENRPDSRAVQRSDRPEKPRARRPSREAPPPVGRAILPAADLSGRLDPLKAGPRPE
jgi:hypothetical protein